MARIRALSRALLVVALGLVVLTELGREPGRPRPQPLAIATAASPPPAPEASPSPSESASPGEAPSPTATTAPTPMPQPTATPAPTPAAPPPPADPAPASSTIAYVKGPGTIQVYGAPDPSKSSMQLPAHNTIDQAAAFLVVDASRPGWYQVLLPVQPNGTRGWLKADTVQTATTNEYLRVYRSQYRLDHFVDGKRQDVFRVGVGRPGTPTPTGLFYVWGSEEVHQAPYTPGIFALSGYTTQPVPGFLGARLGVHGWTDPGVVGHQVSNGCVRMTSKDMGSLLHQILLGTPVEIRG